MTGSAEYRSWSHAKARCENPSDAKYPNYGGRGIAMCDRWRDDFAAFYADMGPRPTPKHSIDRINNDGDYEPGNCRWATATEQRRNRPHGRETRLSFNGVTKNVSEWSRDIGISDVAIHVRLKRGWSIERALTAPRSKRSGRGAPL